MKKCFILLFVLILSWCLSEDIQAQTMLDSLKYTWLEVKDDSLRIAEQNRASFFLYSQYEGEMGKSLTLATLKEARALGLVEMEKKSLLLLALFSQDLGEIENFNSYWIAAYQMSVEQRDTSDMLELLNTRGSQFVNEMKYDSAVVVYHQALDLVQSNSYLSFQYSIHNNLAIVFAEQGLLVKAKGYFEQAAKASLLAGDSMVVFLAYLNVARCFLETDQLDSATTYIELADNWKYLEIQEGLLANYTEMAGRLAKARGDYPAALAYFEQAVAQSETNTDIIKQLAEVGFMQFELKNYDLAIATLTQVEDMSSKSGDNLILRDILPILAKSHAALDKHSLAYEYSQRAITLRDELLDEEVQNQVAEMQARFELKELSKDKDILEALARTQQKQVQQRTTFAVLATLLVILIASLLLVVWRKNRRIASFNQKLEKEVKARTRELEHSNEELQRYLEDMKMFTHVTSHDLKEPLRNISGFSSLLERRMKIQLQDEDSKTFMQMIRSNANQMHRLIESIQLYTQFEEKWEEDKFLEEVSLEEITETIERTLSTSIQEKEAKVEYLTELPDIYTSASVLQVVLKNLIENGIKYNRSSPPIVTIDYKLVNNFHCIAIKDNGIGIEAEFQAQIFEMFKRLHTQQEFKGTGMGLAISRKLAHRFGGDILLESKVGQGSTFVLKLPAK